MPTITVYTKNACQPCMATKRWLVRAGIPFTERNIDLLLASAIRDRDALIAEGYTTMPVVIVSHPGRPDLTWQGLRPDMLESLKTAWEAVA